MRHKRKQSSTGMLFTRQGWVVCRNKCQIKSQYMCLVSELSTTKSSHWFILKLTWSVAGSKELLKSNWLEIKNLILFGSNLLWNKVGMKKRGVRMVIRTKSFHHTSFWSKHYGTPKCLQNMIPQNTNTGMKCEKTEHLPARPLGIQICVKFVQIYFARTW